MSKKTATFREIAETLEEAIRSAVTDEVFSQRVTYGRREVWNVLVRNPSSGQWEAVLSVEEARAVVAVSMS